jgi:uncharacterized protein
MPLSSAEPKSSGFTIPRSAPPAFHILMKPTGAVCNLYCKYCFFLSKKSLYPDSKFQMSEDILEMYLKQHLESHQAPDVVIAWQGGEPTLIGLDFFKKSVELVNKLKRPDQKVSYTVQTNGTQLNDAWCEFFKANNFLIGLSTDGPKNIHDTYRRTRSGDGSFDQVMRGLDFLKKHKVDVNILCTVNAANQDHPLEVYRFFRDELGISFIQFIPIIERVSAADLTAANEGDQVTDRSVDPLTYGKFLSAVFDEWVKADVGRVYVQHFDSALANWIGVPGAVCVFSPVCGTALCLEHNGDLYSCDHFVDPNYKLGNIQEKHLIDLISSDQQRKFGLAKAGTLPKYCRDCSVKFACHGECPKNRFIKTPDGEDGLNYLCSGYKEFFAHIDKPMKVMAALLRTKRFADEIMGMPEQEKETLVSGVRI